MKFDRLICDPTGSGYEFRIYMENGNYVTQMISAETARDLVQFISDVERAKRLALAAQETEVTDAQD